MKKRILSFLLVIAMLVGILPVQVFAAESASTEIDTGVTEAAQGYALITKMRLGVDVESCSISEENHNAFTFVLVNSVDAGTAIPMEIDFVGFNASCFTGFTSYIYVNGAQDRATPAAEGENGKWPGSWSGSVTPEWKEDGTAVITITTKGGSPTDYTVTLINGSESGSEEEPEATVAVSDVTLDQTEVAVEVGQTVTLTAAVSPENATDKTVTWSSSDETVATVADGVVTAVTAGEATIIATAGDKSVSCTVTVTAPAVSEVQLDKTEAALKLDGTLTLTATVLPEAATDKTVTWSSSNEAVATVADGVVTAVALGEATITATAGEHSAECKVTVYEPYTGSVDLETGDTDSQGSQRVRVKNINISGVEVYKYQKTGDYSATVLLPADTLKGAEMTFTLDCVGNPDIVNGQIHVNNVQCGTMTANEGSTTEGTWTYSMVPQWDENGEATISFKAQWRTMYWVAKTYTLNLRILGEENAAPVFKSDAEKEITELIAVGESFTLNLNEAALWEDAELDDMSYTVSVNGADPVEANGTFYQFGPKVAGDYTLVFRAKDSEGNESADTYTVKITAMNLTKFETGGTAVDAWNADINRIDMGLAEVDEVILSEEEGVYAYAILDKETSKEDKLFFRVKASARVQRFFGVNINGKGVDGAETDATNFIWTAEYLPEWDDYGEATLAFAAQPQNNNKYIYTIKLKIANEENQAPAFADGGTKTDTVEQYYDYTVNVAELFDGVDDGWLWYSVSVNGGEYTDCGESFTITPHTTDTVTLKFKAKDLLGAESEEFVLTLNVSEYEISEGSFAINNMTDDGLGLLSMTVQNENGEMIEDIKFESTTESKTETFNSGSEDEETREWKETTIKVGLPETIATNGKVVAQWHMVQDEAGVPILSTNNFFRDVSNNTKDGVSTTLNGGVGSSTVYFFEDAEITYLDGECADRYIVEYYIDHGENNKAPQLKEGVPSYAEVTMDQYQTYSVNLNDIFTEPDGDKVTYTVKVDGETKEIGNSYSYELTTDDDITIIFKATDYMGATCTYVVDLTVNTVHRYSIETGETGHWARGGVITAIIIDGPETENSAYVKTDDTHRVVYVQLKDTVADNAEVTINWVNNASDGVNLNPANPIKLVDGEATVEIETTGNFFFKTKYYYTIHISNKANNLPVLAENVPAEVEEEHLVGTAYELDLSNIFTDADGDALSYTVSVDDADAVAADASYSFPSSKTGTYKLVFRAKDAWGTSVATYTVNLKVKNSDNTFDVVIAVPDAITPSFYICGSFAENGQDTLGDALTTTKGESADGWTSYTVAVPENISRISFRGTDGTNDWGGMTIAVEKDMAAVTLRQVQAVINSKIDTDEGKVAPTAEQAVFQIKYNVNEEGKYAVNGTTGNDDYGYLYYRFLLVAADNSIVYTYNTVPQGELTNSFATNEGQTKTITTESAQVMIQTLPMATKNAFTITVPSEATAVMYRQAGYFNYVEIPVFDTIDNGDGTKDVVFNNVGSKAIFRVSMDGKVTKAGYSTANYGGEGSVVIDWEDDDREPEYRGVYDTSTMMGSRGDDSMYVNVNYRNNLQLAVDETFQLRAYRIWEIIDTDTTNIMIEPDFHYNIISGSDVIDINPTDDIGGIAGNSWLDITPKKEGTAILEVTYDAIDIVSISKMGGFSNVDEDFTYNASDPARTALVVVQVGGAQNDINFGFKLDRSEGWDVEFDTLYFTGDQGQLQLKPTVITDGEIAKVEVSGDKGQTYTQLTAGEDGYYTANIVPGNNIIRVTKTDGSEHYQVVRGDKISLTISEVAGASDQDGVIDAGEKIHIKFNGVHNVVGKMSGIYNPTDYKTNFTFLGETVSGNGGQYTYPVGAQVEVTIPGDADEGAEYTLTDGNTTNGGWGSSGGAHRSVKGEVPPGLDAGTVTNNGRNVFPEVTLTVGETLDEAEQIAVESVELNRMTMELEVGKSNTLTASVKPFDATDRTVTWTSSDEGVATVENGLVTAVSEGTVTITATAGKFSDTCEVTAVPAQEEKPELDFGLDESEIVGYATVSFVDEGIRVEGEEVSSMYAKPLGTIIEATEVPFKAYDTIASVTLRLLKAKGMTESHSGTAESGFYLASIGNFEVNDVYYSAFGEFDAGQGSGWMITQNDVFINKGASEFYIKEGDVIAWQYTCQLGADIGDTFEDEDVSAVKALIDAIGTVTVESEEAIAEAREAYDELSDLQKRMVTNYKTLTDAEKKLAELKATAEDEEAAQKVEKLIDEIGTVTLDSEEAIEDARKAYDALSDLQKDLVSNYETLTDAEELLAALKAPNADYEKIYKDTGDYLEALCEDYTPVVNSIGGDWMVFGLARSDREVPAGYYDEVVKYVNENINELQQLDPRKSTENSRVILALTAAGYDVTDVAGHNLLEGLTNLNYLKKQGINGPVWALIAFDSYDYEIPTAPVGANQVTRENLIDTILAAQLDDGGWNVAASIKTADSDMTAMAITALAPYYDSNAKVKAAVDTALKTLSDLQLSDGSFGSTDGSSAESCAQVLVALTAMGINPERDAWFIKNGNSVVDALCAFAVEDGGFKHIPSDTKADGMATEQGYYALNAYIRFLNDENALFDLTDDEVVVCEHKNTEVQNAKDATCTETGYTGDTYCKDCELLIKVGTETEAKGHSYGQWTVVEKAKIRKEGKEERVCACGEKEFRAIEKLQFPFTDVKETSYAYDTVAWAVDEDITTGMTETTFVPNGEVTRGQVVTFLWRAAGAPKAENVENPFTDVEEGKFYYDAVLWAVENGITNGRTETTFAPKDTCTRGEVVTFLWRFAEKPDVSSAENPFDDLEEGRFYVDAVLWAVEEGITTGIDKVTFGPGQTCKRAQIVTFIYRYMNK